MKKTSYQHRGQALLIAIIVMLFVALISAGFLASVSGNLNQSARESDKARAGEAARAGMKFINDRLESHPEGENWRPQTDPKLDVPLPADADFSAYNTLLMKAQGWAGNYARFPDPRANGSDVYGPDAPQFLARIERVGETLAKRIANNQASSAADDPEATRAGALKITVIGLSKRDPNAFSRLVAYRGGALAAPVGRAMRVVTNWDFKKSEAASGTTTTGAALGATSIVLDDVEGNFPTDKDAKGFWLSAIAPTGAVGSAFATDFDPATKTLTVAALPAAIAANSRIDLAANLGAPLPSQLPLSVAAPTPLPLPDLMATVGSATNTAPESVRVNGGIYWQGNASLTGLQPGSATAPASKVTASGAIIGDTGVQFNGQAATVRSDVVQDGVSNVTEDFDPNRQVKPFSPPDLLSGENQARYLSLTRDSTPSNIAQNGAIGSSDEQSNYGYGKGIFIDNAQDREKIYDAGLGRMREMTQAELLDLWFSRDTTSAQFRLGTAEAANATDASLEEQHLRGWVGPDEFRARGVSIELFNDALDGNKAKLAITRDARADNTPTDTDRALGPVEGKAWKNAAGDALPGVYRQVFDISDASQFNGTIYAQGNVRISGIATGLPQSLTVVSLGNIYVEGNLNLGTTRKVLLLARKNVVMNPTRVLARFDSQTVATGAATLAANATAPLSVGDSGEFRVGDVVELGATRLTDRAVVTNVGSATSLTVRNLTGAAINLAADDRIASATDTLGTGGESLISNATDAIQRRVNVPLPANTLRVLFGHRADRVPALTLDAEAVPLGGALPGNLWMTHKSNATNGVVAPAEKQVGGNYGTTETFPGTAITSDATANAVTVASLETEMESGDHGNQWRYDLTPANATIGAMPLHYLAGVGLLRPYIPPATTQKGVDIIAAPFEVPLAASVGVSLGGTNAPLTGYLDQTASASQATSTFGFNPSWSAFEDATTVDQSFYGSRAIFDSRAVNNVVLGAGEANLVLRQNDAQTGLPALAGLPTYRVNALKLENLGASGALDAATTLGVNAFVYAQTGSWIVLPQNADLSANFKGDATQSYFDFNANNAADAGEFVDLDNNGAFSTGDCADINHDGVQQSGEYVALADNIKRFARPNIQINFRGAIAENQTALVSDGSAAVGPVGDWVSSYASLSKTGTGETWRHIVYAFDADYVTGALEGDAGFRMPLGDDILSQS